MTYVDLSDYNKVADQVDVLMKLHPEKREKTMTYVERRDQERQIITEKLGTLSDYNGDRSPADEFGLIVAGEVISTLLLLTERIRRVSYRDVRTAVHHSISAGGIKRAVRDAERLGIILPFQLDALDHNWSLNWAWREGEAER